MRMVLIAATLVTLSACQTANQATGQLTLAELASANQSSLMQLSTGISKNDVIGIMGSKTAKTGDGIVNNPWTIEVFSGNDNSQYEILYYVTRKNQPFTPVRKSLTTPVILRNGKLVGWGDDALERYK